MTCMFIIISDHEIYEYVDNIILTLSCIPELSCLEKNNRWSVMAVLALMHVCAEICIFVITLS